MITLPKKITKLVKKMQKSELTEHYVYKTIAKRMKNQEDKKIIESIAQREITHYNFWTNVLGIKTKPSVIKILYYNILTILLGYTFTLKIMEANEVISANNYEILSTYVDGANEIAHEEQVHEKELLHMLNEERLNYVGSMVLGLNDALVELSGAIAGLTLALSDPKLISLTALITGIAASLSMAASQYLSAKADNHQNALKSAVYTGIAYIVTVAILVMPYLIIPTQRFVSLGIMLAFVVLIIFLFNYYISVAKSEPFKKRFWQMVIISLSVATISFGIGFLVKILFGISI